MAFSIILVLEKCNLGPWKSLKSAWILYLEFAMNPVSRFVCRRLLVFCSKTNNTCLTVCFFSGQPEQTGTRKIELFFISVRQVRIWGFAVKLFFNYKFRKKSTDSECLRSLHCFGIEVAERHSTRKNQRRQWCGNDFLIGGAVWQTVRFNMDTGSRSRLLIVGVLRCKNQNLW